MLGSLIHKDLRNSRCQSEGFPTSAICRELQNSSLSG
jgi:hypothetical protein